MNDVSISAEVVSVEDFTTVIKQGKYFLPENWGFGLPLNPEQGADDLLRRLAFSWKRKDRVRPVVGVSWFEARAYCHAVGGRLPFADELEALSKKVMAANTRIPLHKRIFHRNVVSEIVKNAVVDFEDTPEWCGNWYNVSRDSRSAQPTPPSRRRVLGFVPPCSDPCCDQQTRISFRVVKTGLVGSTRNQKRK